jgi:hypothetical protein
MRSNLIWVGILVAMWSSVSWATDQATTPEATSNPLKKSPDGSDVELQKLRGILQEGESWADLQRSVARQRLTACTAAFGNKVFCACLNANLHWVLGFDTYIRVITAPGSEPDPSARTEEQRAINSVFRSREKCVARAD